MPFTTATKSQIDNHPETSKEDDYHVTGTLYSLTNPAKPGSPVPSGTPCHYARWPRTMVVSMMSLSPTTRGASPSPERKFDSEPQHGPSPQRRLHRLQITATNDVVFFKEVSVQPLK